MKNILFLIVLGLCMACTSEKNAAQIHNRSLAKYEPASGCLLFVGQELESIGGLDAPYNDGYLDHFNKPAGFTMYTNFTPGDTSFGYVLKGLDGVKFLADWGDSPSHMDLQLADPNFDRLALAIGLSLVNHEEKVADGDHDALINEFGEWAKSIAPRPIFLRIGYEFDGHSWNHYDIDAYKKAYRRIKDVLDGLSCTNIAYVWQSTGWVSDQIMLDEWYPGDEYVDWCAVSFFSRWSEIEMFEFARKKKKPVFIAEATPTISDHMVKFSGDTKDTQLDNKEQADEAWTRWFVPFFKAIHENNDVVKAISYINCNWKSHEMWKKNPTFQGVDARLQLSSEITKKWNDKMMTDDFILADDDPYTIMRVE